MSLFPLLLHPLLLVLFTPLGTPWLPTAGHLRCSKGGTARNWSCATTTQRSILRQRWSWFCRQVKTEFSFSNPFPLFLPRGNFSPPPPSAPFTNAASEAPGSRPGLGDAASSERGRGVDEQQHRRKRRQCRWQRRPLLLLRSLRVEQSVVVVRAGLRQPQAQSLRAAQGGKKT